MKWKVVETLVYEENNDRWNVIILLCVQPYYMEFCPFQLPHLQLVSKSTIFLTIDVTISMAPWLKKKIKWFAIAYANMTCD